MSHVRLRCSLKIQTTHSSEQCWPILERRSDDYYISHYYENIIILWYGYRWNQAFKPRRLAVITAEIWLFWYGANNIIKTAINQQGQRDVRGVSVKGEYTTSHAVLKYPPRCGECSCTEKNILNQHTPTHRHVMNPFWRCFCAYVFVADARAVSIGMVWFRIWREIWFTRCECESYMASIESIWNLVFGFFCQLWR